MASKALGTSSGNEGNTLSTAQLPLPKLPLPFSKGELLHPWALNFPATPHSRGVPLVLLYPQKDFLGKSKQARFPGVLEDSNVGAALLFAAHLADTLPFQGQLPLPKLPLPLSKGEFLHTWARSILGTLISLRPFIPEMPLWITDAPCFPGGLSWEIQSSPRLSGYWRTQIWKQLSRPRYFWV